MPLALLLFEYPTLNGGERSVLCTLNDVRAAGYEMQAIAPPDGPLADELQRLQIVHWPLSYAEGEMRRGLDDIRLELGEVVSQADPDLLHANSLSTSRISGPVAKRLSVKSIGHLRDIVRISRQAVEDLNCHDRLLAVSNATRDFHVAAGLDSDKVFTVYNGIDLNEFRPSEPTGFLHRELGLESNEPLIAAIGQIGLRKGFDVFLAAAEMVSATCPSAHYLIIGERHSQKEESRQLEASLTALSRRDPLAGRVHFLGWRFDVAKILPELTMLVHPARQEPLGRVLLEAAACGVPIVATDVGGTREILGDDSPAGDLVPVDHAEQMAAGIVALLREPTRRRQLRGLVRARVEQKFSRHDAAAALLSHYAANLQSRPDLHT